MSENKSCREFIAAYKSKLVNCATCKWWDSFDFVCANPEELAKRNKDKEFDSLDREMRSNKSVRGPL